MKLLADLILNGARAVKISNVIANGMGRHERNTGSMRPDRFKDLKTEEWEVDGFRVLTVQQDKSTDRHVILLHGGGYVSEASSSHRRITEALVKDYGLKVTVIDYPLAPENKYDRTHEVVMRAYREITEKNTGDEFYMFGDSAGGGLALALLQELRDKRIMPFPKRTVLFSPWIDLTMSSPGIDTAIENDPLFTIDGLKRAAGHYAGDADKSLPLISPLYGRMDNLGDILLLTGTHEVLNPEIKRLRDKIMAAYGTNLEFYEGEKMVHDWILGYPFFPESRRALEMAGRFYTK